MANRKINEFLASGEAKTIKVAENIQYTKAALPEYEGMFMRIGAGGATILYKAVDQDVIVEDTVNVSTPIPTAWTEMFSITTTHEITPDNGTFSFSGDFFNDSPQNRELRLRVKVDGTQVRNDFVFDLQRDNGSLHQQVAMNTTPLATVPVGSVITLELMSDNDGAVTMNGDYQIARFRAIAAQAAPVNAQSDIGLGTPGQILATDASGTSLEWTDVPSGGGPGCDMTASQCAAIKANTDLLSTNKVVDMNTLLMHENNAISHTTYDQHKALENANSPSETNVFATLSDIAVLPTVDGEYKLVVTGGLADWVKVV